MNFDQELYRLAFTKMVLGVIPPRLRHRAALKLYNYFSDDIKGIDIVVQQAGYKLLVNTKDLIGWNIFFFSSYEANTNKLLRKYIKPGDTVVEAGANIGTETILLANLVGDNGKVFAFEPNKDVFNRLSYNAGILNKKTNIACLDMALGEKDGTIQFYTYPETFPNSGMGSKYHESPDVIHVQQATLDSLVKDGTVGKVDFLKMDVQGAELDVLTGAQATLDRFRPHIFLEAHEQQDKLFDILKAHGYVVHAITDAGLQPINAPVKQSLDWLAVHSDKLSV